MQEEIVLRLGVLRQALDRETGDLQITVGELEPEILAGSDANLRGVVQARAGEVVGFIIRAGKVCKRFHAGGVVRAISLEVADRLSMLSADRVSSAAKQISRMESGVVPERIAQLLNSGGIIFL